DRTCVVLTETYLSTEDHTFGIHVYVRHHAPTKIGQSVSVTATVLEAKENKILYTISATNDRGAKIGTGTHRRAVIDTKRFGNNA
ncbi:MAG: thioesterase family protein, partial [Candidatus Binatia bacterium]